MMYKAITSQNIEEFNVRCNEILAKGYMPIGGVSVILGPNANYTRYTQAFINENSNY